MKSAPQFHAIRGALLRVVGAGASLLLAFAVMAADESAPVPKPDVKVGDGWRYRVSMHDSNVPTVIFINSRVSFVAPDAIVAVETGSDGRESDSQFDSEWGVSSLGYLGLVFDPPMKFSKYPLQVGTESPYVYGLAAVRGGPARTRAEGRVKVVGWEDVAVPAGKFRALKIEASGSFQRLDINARGWQRFTLWYVPAVKRFVKSTVESGTRAPNQLDLIRTTELVEFKVQ
jgi:hypothetical protein